MYMQHIICYYLEYASFPPLVVFVIQMQGEKPGFYCLLTYEKAVIRVKHISSAPSGRLGRAIFSQGRSLFFPSSARWQDGMTGLMLAASNGHGEVLKVLLAAKADLHAANKVRSRRGRW